MLGKRKLFNEVPKRISPIVSDSQQGFWVSELEFLRKFPCVYDARYSGSFENNVPLADKILLHVEVSRVVSC
jgi:hypothetical protein